MQSNDELNNYNQLWIGSWLVIACAEMNVYSLRPEHVLDSACQWCIKWLDRMFLSNHGMTIFSRMKLNKFRIPFESKEQQRIRHFIEYQICIKIA